MEPRPVLRTAFGEDTKLVAVIEIQCAKAGDLARSLPATLDAVGFWTWCIGHLPLRLRQGLLQNTLPDGLGGVSLSEIPGQTDKALLTGRAHRNILAEFHLIALLAKQIVKLLFGDALPDQLIDLAADQSAPGGTLLLLCTPFPIVL